MNSIVKSLREQAFELLQNQPISKLANLMEFAALEIETKAATVARLTAANESMQEDAVQNTYAFGQMLHANKEQAEEIKTLKQALTDIRATTVILGDSQGAWKAWRECCEIAGKALK